MLVRHISFQHAAKPNFKVKCGVDGCPEQYKKMNSFRKHLRTCHAHEYSENFQGQAEEQPKSVTEGTPIESNSDMDSDDDDVYDKDGDNEAFNPVMYLFLLKHEFKI